MTTPQSGDKNTRSSEDSEIASGDGDSGLDLIASIRRVIRGFYQIAALGLFGLVLASVLYALLSPATSIQTSTRVSFSFPGFEKGLYPDDSKFQADDLRAPVIIAEAMRRQGIKLSEDNESKIRNSIIVEGVIPDSILKTRDRLRGMGQTPPPYLPDEYMVTMTLSSSFPLTGAQRESLLIEIVNAARDNFKKTYGQLPVAFGSAFETLKGCDLPDYEIVFNSEVENVTTYLNNQIEVAKGFRSPRTNFSFKDLLEQVNLFSELQLNQILGIIHQYGLARDRKAAITKLNFDIRQIKYNLDHASEDETVVKELLAQAQSREQSYVLGVKSQTAARPGEAPILDQGLVDSLVANDGYNFLLRQALQSGLKVKSYQSQLKQTEDLLDNLVQTDKSSNSIQTELLTLVDSRFSTIKDSYAKLVDNIQRTHSDFADQEYGNAIRLSAEVHSTSFYRTLAKAALVGAFLGASFGVGLSFLGIYLGRSRT